MEDWGLINVEVKNYENLRYDSEKNLFYLISARLDYSNLAYIFCLDNPKYVKEAQKFRNANIPNSYIFTRDFDIEGKHYRYHVPEVNPYNPNKPYCFLDKDRPNHYFFEGDFERGELWQNS